MKSGARSMLAIAAIAVLVVFGSAGHVDAQHTVSRAIDGRPEAIVDSRTSEGVRLVRGQWRCRDARGVDAYFRAPGPDLKPSGAAIKTLDIVTKGGPGIEDWSTWEAIPAEALEARRSSGRLSFTWYRTSVTIPEMIGTFNAAGATVVFEIVVDDYAEVWVDGKLPRVVGQTGASLIRASMRPIAWCSRPTPVRDRRFSSPSSA